MRVCIDTNVLVQLFGQNQASRPIREALLVGRIELAVSNEILFEYQETVTRLLGAAHWQQVERFLTLLFSITARKGQCFSCSSGHAGGDPVGRLFGQFIEKIWNPSGFQRLGTSEM